MKMFKKRDIPSPTHRCRQQTIWCMVTHHGIVCFDRCCDAGLYVGNTVRLVLCVVNFTGHVKGPHGPIVPDSHLRVIAV
jgi:hypothetical protein